MAFEALDAIFGPLQPYEMRTTLYSFCYIFLYISEWVKGKDGLRIEKFKYYFLVLSRLYEGPPLYFKITFANLRI